MTYFENRKTFKSLRITLLSLSLVASALMSPAPASAAKGDPGDVVIELCGDVNLDGSVDAADREAMRQIVAGIWPIPRGTVADLNRDDAVDARDFILIDNFLSGLGVQPTCD